MLSLLPFLLFLTLTTPWALLAEVVQPDEPDLKPPPKPVPTVPVGPTKTEFQPATKPTDPQPAPVPPGPKTMEVDEPGFKATVKFAQPAAPKTHSTKPSTTPKQFLRRTVWSVPQEIGVDGQPLVFSEAETEAAAVQQEETLSPAMEAMIAREKGRKPREIAQMYSEVLRTEPNNAEAHYRQGLALLRDNDVTNGLVALSMALKLAPGNSKYQCDFGLAVLRAGDRDKALLACQSAAVSAPAVARYQSALGDCFLSLGRGSEAAQSYQRAMAIESTNPNYVFNYGLSLMNQKLFKKAIDAFDEAIRLNPNNPQYYCSRGVALENTKKIREAIGCYMRALAIDKNFPRAHHLLAGAYSDPSDPTFTSSLEAVEHANQAVKLTKWKNAEYMMGLARALRVAHNFDEAVEVARKAVALEPRDDYRRELAALEKLQNEGGFELTK